MPESATAKRQVPIEPGLFTIPSSPDEQPGLLGTRCRRCGQRFFPRKGACLRCTSRDVEDVTLSTRGTVANFTVARMALPASVIKAPYAVAQIRLLDGADIQAVLAGCEVTEVHAGMPVAMALVKIKEDEAGNDVISFQFRPVPAPEIGG